MVYIYMGDILSQLTIIHHNQHSHLFTRLLQGGSLGKHTPRQGVGDPVQLSTRQLANLIRHY